MSVGKTNSSNCSPLTTIKNYPVRSTLFVALVAIAAIGILLTAYSPSVHSFLTSKIGYGVLGGSSLVGLGILAWIFKPACHSKRQGASESLLADNKQSQFKDEEKPESIKFLTEFLQTQNLLLLAPEEQFENDPEKEDLSFEKLFNTRPMEGLTTANNGDYSFTKYMRDPFLIMTIIDQRAKVQFPKIPVMVRKSTSVKDSYRLVFEENGKYRQSSWAFTGPQISTMLRWAQLPPEGFRVSGLTNQTRKTSGFIIFTPTTKATSKEYWIANPDGLLVKVPPESLAAILS